MSVSRSEVSLASAAGSINGDQQIMELSSTEKKHSETVTSLPSIEEDDEKTPLTENGSET